MIENEDLPFPWRVAIAPNEDIRSGLDDLLKISEPVSAENDLDFESWGSSNAKLPVSDRAKLRTLHTWELIENQITSESAWIRLQESLDGVGVVISGAVFLPKAPGERLNNRTIRALPLASIESSINVRKQLDRAYLRIGFALANDDWSPTEEVGNPRKVPNFYERVASQFLDMKRRDIQKPVHAMAELNKRPLKTVQGWITEARRRQLLPPASPGLAS